MAPTASPSDSFDIPEWQVMAMGSNKKRSLYENRKISRNSKMISGELFEKLMKIEETTKRGSTDSSKINNDLVKPTETRLSELQKEEVNLLHMISNLNSDMKVRVNSVKQKSPNLKVVLNTSDTQTISTLRNTIKANSKDINNNDPDYNIIKGNDLPNSGTKRDSLMKEIDNFNSNRIRTPVTERISSEKHDNWMVYTENIIDDKVYSENVKNSKIKKKTENNEHIFIKSLCKVLELKQQSSEIDSLFSTNVDEHILIIALCGKLRAQKKRQVIEENIASEMISDTNESSKTLERLEEENESDLLNTKKVRVSKLLQYRDKIVKNFTGNVMTAYAAKLSMGIIKDSFIHLRKGYTGGTLTNITDKLTSFKFTPYKNYQTNMKIIPTEKPPPVKHIYIADNIHAKNQTKKQLTRNSKVICSFLEIYDKNEKYQQNPVENKVYADNSMEINSLERQKVVEKEIEEKNINNEEKDLEEQIHIINKIKVSETELGIEEARESEKAAETDYAHFSTTKQMRAEENEKGNTSDVMNGVRVQMGKLSNSTTGVPNDMFHTNKNKIAMFENDKVEDHAEIFSFIKNTEVRQQPIPSTVNVMVRRKSSLNTGRQEHVRYDEDQEVIAPNKTGDKSREISLDVLDAQNETYDISRFHTTEGSIECNKKSCTNIKEEENIQTWTPQQEASLAFSDEALLFFENSDKYHDSSSVDKQDIAESNAFNEKTQKIKLASENELETEAFKQASICDNSNDTRKDIVNEDEFHEIRKPTEESSPLQFLSFSYLEYDNNHSQSTENNQNKPETPTKVIKKKVSFSGDVEYIRDAPSCVGGGTTDIEKPSQYTSACHELNQTSIDEEVIARTEQIKRLIEKQNLIKKTAKLENGSPSSPEPNVTSVKEEQASYPDEVKYKESPSNQLFLKSSSNQHSEIDGVNDADNNKSIQAASAFRTSKVSITLSNKKINSLNHELKHVIHMNACKNIVVNTNNSGTEGRTSIKNNDRELNKNHVMTETDFTSDNGREDTVGVVEVPEEKIVQSFQSDQKSQVDFQFDSGATGSNASQFIYKEDVKTKIDDSSTAQLSFPEETTTNNQVAISEYIDAVTEVKYQSERKETSFFNNNNNIAITNNEPKKEEEYPKVSKNEEESETQSIDDVQETTAFPCFVPLESTCTKRNTDKIESLNNMSQVSIESEESSIVNIKDDTKSKNTINASAKNLEELSNEEKHQSKIKGNSFVDHNNNIHYENKTQNNLKQCSDVGKDEGENQKMNLSATVTVQQIPEVSLQKGGDEIHSTEYQKRRSAGELDYKYANTNTSSTQTIMGKTNADNIQKAVEKSCRSSLKMEVEDEVDLEISKDGNEMYNKTLVNDFVSLAESMEQPSSSNQDIDMIIEADNSYASLCQEMNKPLEHEINKREILLRNLLSKIHHAKSLDADVCVKKGDNTVKLEIIVPPRITKRETTTKIIEIRNNKSQENNEYYVNERARKISQIAYAMLRQQQLSEENVNESSLDEPETPTKSPVPKPRPRQKFDIPKLKSVSNDNKGKARPIPKARPGSPRKNTSSAIQVTLEPDESSKSPRKVKVFNIKLKNVSPDDKVNKPMSTKTENISSRKQQKAEEEIIDQDSQNELQQQCVNTEFSSGNNNTFTQSQINKNKLDLDINEAHNGTPFEQPQKILVETQTEKTESYDEDPCPRRIDPANVTGMTALVKQHSLAQAITDIKGERISHVISSNVTIEQTATPVPARRKLPGIKVVMDKNMLGECPSIVSNSIRLQPGTQNTNQLKVFTKEKSSSKKVTSLDAAISIAEPSLTKVTADSPEKTEVKALSEDFSHQLVLSQELNLTDIAGKRNTLIDTKKEQKNESPGVEVTDNETNSKEKKYEDEKDENKSKKEDKTPNLFIVGAPYTLNNVATSSRVNEDKKIKKQPAPTMRLSSSPTMQNYESQVKINSSTRTRSNFTVPSRVSGSSRASNLIQKFNSCK